LSELRIATAEAFEPLLQDARYKGAWGGRGSAKSHFFAGLVIEDAIVLGEDIVCIREIQRTLDQSVKKLLELKIQQENVGNYFDVQDRKIVTSPANGGRGVITFEGMQNHTADSIKSLEGYGRAWVEEAQTLSQRSLDLLRPTIRKPGSQLWFSWNPRYATDPVDMLLRGETPRPIPSWSRRITGTTPGFPMCCGRRWNTTSAATRRNTPMCGSASTSSTARRGSSRIG
jgi:phage terminase large subunit